MKRIAFALLVLSVLVVGAFLALHRPGAEASPDVTITVNSTADTNSGDSVMTLREAMLLATGDLAVTELSWEECNQVSGASWDDSWCLSPVPIGPGTPESIVFDTSVFPSGSPATISLNFTLPTLDTGGDTIDGSSAGVIVDGGGVGFACFSIWSDSNAIRGLQIYNCYTAITILSGAQHNTIGGSSPGERNVISGNDVFGVLITQSANDNAVKGNYIGTNASGTAALPNGEEGIVIAGGAQNNTVEGNVISGNDQTGVRIDDSDGNVVKDNYIGTNASGTAAVPNHEGVVISAGAQNNTLGGATAGERNLISGNFLGVQILAPQTNGNVVKGNYIGTNAAGTAAVPNVEGVVIEGYAQNNIIGGTAPGERNVISGNDGHGIQLSASGNVVKGNYIGTNAAGAAAIPNAGHGVLVGSDTQYTTIGGTGAGEGNVIAYNAGDGVRVRYSAGNRIRGNSIHSNGGKGIENRDGGNEELTPPSINGFGSVMGTACANCTIDVYSDDADEGRGYEGSTTASGVGNWTFSGSLDGPNVTATATDAAGNTSEFSAPVALPEPTPTPSPTPTPTGTPTPTPGATPTPPAGPTRTLQWGVGWHNATWSGASTPAEAFACAAGKYAAAYRFTDAGLERYFPDRLDISNMGPLSQHDAFLILITQPVTCAMPVAAASGSSRTLQWGVGWQNVGWSGADGTAPQQAFACAGGSYAAAYRFTDAGLERYFPDRPDISNMGPLNKYDAFLILVTAPVYCTMAIAP